MSEEQDKENQKKFYDEIKALQEKYDVEMIPRAFIDDQGRVGAEVLVAKKSNAKNIITQDTIIQDVS